MTTHSPLFFAPGATASFVRVAKEPAEPKPVGRLRAVNFDLDKQKAEVFRMARFENADAAFFSRRVVLFEGESDDAFFKHVAKILNPAWDFDAKNVAMVRVSGKGNFQRFRSFFEAFGIDVKIVADLDAFFEGYHLLGIGDQVQEARQAAIGAVDARIKALGIRAEPTGRQIKDKVMGASWKQRYERAKEALRAAQESGGLSGDTLTVIDGLFTWEADIARGRACRQDRDARAALMPAFSQIRASGVHILSRGAIEDYYPDGTLTNGPKPDRALDACRRITTIEHARALSDPLGDNAETEIAMICGDLFLGL